MCFAATGFASPACADLCEPPFGPDFRWIEVAPSEADTSIAPAVLPAKGDPRRQADAHLAADRRRSCLPPGAKARGVDVDAEIVRLGDAVPPTFWLRDPEGNPFCIIDA